MSEKNKLTLSVQYADPRLQEEITRPMIRKWVKAALFAPAELTIRFVDAEEGQELNREQGLRHQCADLRIQRRGGGGGR
jgi:probable rRNA maturation factor